MDDATLQVDATLKDDSTLQDDAAYRMMQPILLSFYINRLLIYNPI